MRRAQAPYAIAAVLVLVVSVAVLAGALAMGGLLDEHVATGVSPAPSAARTAVELSRSGRLAYWRTEPNGDHQLWVSNVDGSGKHPIAKIDLLSRVSSTRWSPDGNAVAYLDRGQAIAVQRLDGAGARYELGLPQSLVAFNSRIIDYSWSTDGASIAATVRVPSPVGSDDTVIYVADAAGGSWRSVTNLRNAFLSQWISPDLLLIHTQTGLIGTVGAADGSRLTPLTGLVATSPFLGDDGRIYFLAGQVAPTIRDQTVPVVNAAQARVWSTTLDYEGDARPETTPAYDDVRLVARWPNGRFVVHQGASTALAFLSTGTPPIDTTLGVVDRIVFAPDRRTGIGLTTTRIYRYDVAQPDKPVVLLSDVTQPDAWYPPNPLTVARSSPAPAGQARPAARYVFTLGGLLWMNDANGPRLLRLLGTDDRGLRRLSGVAVPQWSPKGDRVLYFDVPGNTFAGGVFVTDTAGTGGRISDQDAAGPFPAWTPDGNVAYTALLGARDSAGFAAQGDVRVVSPSTGLQVMRYNAREIAFGGGKTFLIDNGRPAPPGSGLPTRTDHAILEVTATGTRVVATAASLSVFERFGGATGIPWQLSMLGASADGTFLSVRESPAVGSVGFTFALLRASDGTGVQGLSGADVADVRWAPMGHLVGMTLVNVPIVRDAETGAIVASAGSGRFAGWSPDGKWFYVARDVGLYAMPLAGGDAVRISALGVPVSTTTP